jgi:arylsulfatase
VNPVRTRLGILRLASLALVLVPLAAATRGAQAEPPPFSGRIGDTWRDSVPDFPRGPTPPPEAPNVVVIVLDDGGFAHLGSYGGPTPTPHLDALAERGLRYTQFHVNPVCSPTRAALLTGRNAHAVGMGAVAELASGYPGYDAHIPRSAATVARVLGDAGWTTYAVGKWHLTPWNAWTAAGPFDRRPLGLGFDRFYGFLGGRSDHFAPMLWEDNRRIPVPRGDGYHLTTDLTDRAIAMMRDHVQAAPGRPFFLYLAYGAVHSPHQSPAEWRERFAGKFDDGWDVWRERVFARQKELGVVPASTELPPRHPQVPAWADLSPDERSLALRFQETFAAMLAHTDEQIGRLLAALDRLGARADTLVVVVSDNGASRAGAAQGLVAVDRYRNGIRQSAAEMMKEIDLIGGPASDPDYPMGWAMVANTPFRRFKGETDAGGTRVPFILSWPGKVPAGGVRPQFHHAVDLAPTLYDLVGIEPPRAVDGVEQTPLDGVSMVYTFADAEAPTRKKLQYWENAGHRALWRDGWLGVDLHQRGQPWDDDDWEVYDTQADFALARDLAGERRDHAAALAAAWWGEARRNHVLPLDDRGFEKTLDTSDGFRGGAPPERYVYFPGGEPIPVVAAPRVNNRSHVITAYVTVPDRGAEGVLACYGSRFGGWSLYLQGGRVVYAHNFLALAEHRLVSTREVAGGEHQLALRFTVTGPGVGTAELSIDGNAAGRLEGIPNPKLGYGGDEGLQIGRNEGSAVSEQYMVPFAFTGALDRVEIELPRAEAPARGGR